MKSETRKFRRPKTKSGGKINGTAFKTFNLKQKNIFEADIYSKSGYPKICDSIRWVSKIRGREAEFRGGGNFGKKCIRHKCYPKINMHTKLYPNRTVEIWEGKEFMGR